VTVNLHGGRTVESTSTGHKHHKRHHPHQSKNLGTASGKAAKKTAGIASKAKPAGGIPLGAAGQAAK
jgi:hypothetical protein